MQSPATRRYKKRSLTVLAGYFVIFLVTMYVVTKVHPTGWLLGVFAALPTLPIVAVFFFTGEYLGTEKDDFKRDLMMRCLLWGTGSMLTVTLFASFMRIFGWSGTVYPFIEFYVFMLGVLAAKLSYRVSNPLPADE